MGQIGGGNRVDSIKRQEWIMPRRHFAKVSITAGACVTCGLPSGGFAAATPGDSIPAVNGAGYDLWFVGAQRETIMNGRLAVAIDLKPLLGAGPLYGLGPIEQVRGPLT